MIKGVFVFIIKLTIDIFIFSDKFNPLTEMKVAIDTGRTKSVGIDQILLTNRHCMNRLTIFFKWLDYTNENKIKVSDGEKCN